MSVSLREKEVGTDIFEVFINAGDVTIRKDEINAFLGYTDNNLPVYFKNMIDFVSDRFPEKSNLKAGYRLFELSLSPGRFDGLQINGIFFKMGKIVVNHLKKAHTAAVFLCTIGPEMENWSKQKLKEDDPVLSFLIDAVASEAMERVTDVLRDHIGHKMAAEGLKITNRYSPGCCNWSVAEQHLLFSLLPEKFCGVRLTKSALMLPIKSTSGVIGIGENVEFRDYICDECGMENCSYRINKMDTIKSIN
ncbi:MAG: hypothetical protein JXR46_05035 [Calditrichaceae bacterium]|nr:hypothetical protein [Calditrichaceae bacterium]MBN2708393.1 hypothetical protein [Calditrichaceae bacterium]